MKRRSFLRSIASTAILPVPLLGLESCQDAVQMSQDTYSFDEIIDRTGTNSIKYGRLEGTGQDKIPMTIADMDFKTAPAVSQALRARLDRDVMGYTRTPEDYYESIVSWVRNQTGWDIQREWVEYCPGVITTLCLAIECYSEKGDKIIVQPPVYDPFMNYSRRLGREVVYNPLILKDGVYQMDFDQLESVIDDKTKMLILCNPHNPGGRMWDKQSLMRLAHICHEHHIVVISDEIHNDLTLFGKKHVPFLSVSQEAAQTGVILTGPTKTFNLAGLGAAQCYIVNEDLRKTLVDYMDNHKLSEASITTMVLTIAGYTKGYEWLDDLRSYIGGNVTYALETFQKRMPQIKVTKPEASFLLWLDCRDLKLEQKDLVSLFQDKAGVMINNGAGYGPGGEGFIRMNIGCPRSVLEEALDRIANALG